MFDAITHQSVTDEAFSALRTVSADRGAKISHATPRCVAGSPAPPPQVPFQPTPREFPDHVTLNPPQGQAGVIVAAIPPRMLADFGPEEAKLMAAALTEVHKFQLKARPSRFLVRGTELAGSETRTWDERLHLEVRWGQLRACTLVKGSGPQAQRLAALFDPHEPPISHPGPELISSAAFMSRLPREVWLGIVESLPVRDRRNFAEAGKAVRETSAVLSDIAYMRACAKRLLSELKSCKPDMSIAEVFRWQQAWNSPLVSDADRQSVLDMLRPEFEILVSAMYSRKGARERVLQMIFFSPAPVRDLMQQVAIARSQASA